MNKESFRKAVQSKLLAAALCLFATCASAQGIRPHVELPDEPVRSVIFNNCASCHGINEYAYHALDRDGWQQLIRTLHAPLQSQGKSVSLAQQDENLLLEFLTDSYGTETIPFPRQYTPPEISTYFSNADARVFMDRECTKCHELRVFRQRNTEARWRDLMLDMRGNGAEISDEDMERLVIWLGQQRGLNASN